MSVTADDVLRDIAFELAQSTLARDDVAKAIDGIRRQQHQMRDSLLKADTADARAIAIQQFQLNDMLLAVLHELALNVRAVQSDMRSLSRYATGSETPGPVEPSPPAKTPRNPALLPDRALQAVRSLQASGPLQVVPEVRPVQITLLGGFLTRLRGVIHRLPVFYVNRMAAQQAVANQAISDALLQIAQEQARLRELLNSKLDGG